MSDATSNPYAPAINTSERLFDLVRYARRHLHDSNLISDSEYAWLCAGSPMAVSEAGGSPSPRRLEEYDQLIARVKRLEDAGNELLYNNDDIGNINRWHKAKETNP